MSTLTSKNGREYLRVSYDKSGRERSQDEQRNENASIARGSTLSPSVLIVGQVQPN